MQIKIRLFQIAQGFFDLKGHKGSHTGVEQWSQVWQMILPFDMRRQQAARKIQWFLNVFERFNLHTDQ